MTAGPRYRTSARATQKTPLAYIYMYILWRVSPMRELLKRGASKQARNRRTSVYRSLLCNARNSRKSSHASPSSLVATQHRGKSISAAVSRHASIAGTFSERSALTVLRVSDSRADRRDRRQCSGSMRMTSGSVSCSSEPA
jgi:hypothetical protein